MKSSSLPLLFALLSMLLFPLGIHVMESTRAWGSTLAVALPAVALALTAVGAGARILRRGAAGRDYGFAMTGAVAGGFSAVFWLVMVPMLLLIALPAREADSPAPRVEQSCDRMKILARQVKSFHLEHGRLPVRLAELVEKDYIDSHLLYDPRQRRRDAPSYRLMVREMPPPDKWDETPLLEGRIPDAEGNRLIVYPNETCGTIR